MLRTSLTAFVALTLISATAQASPFAGSVKIAAAPGYAAPGEPAPAPAPTPAPAPYAEPAPAPAPYGQPAPAPYGQDPYAQPGPQPAPAYQPPPPPPRRRGKGMMIAGWTIFGASYLSTALIGAAIYDTRRVCDDVVGEDGCRNGNPGLLFIPVFGPLIGIKEIGSGTATGTIAGVFLFLAQATGLSLGIAGTALFVRDGKRNRAMQQQQTGLHLGRGVHLSAAPRLGGGNFNLTYNF